MGTRKKRLINEPGVTVTGEMDFQVSNLSNDGRLNPTRVKGRAHVKRRFLEGRREKRSCVTTNTRGEANWSRRRGGDVTVKGNET